MSQPAVWRELVAGYGCRRFRFGTDPEGEAVGLRLAGLASTIFQSLHTGPRQGQIVQEVNVNVEISLSRRRPGKAAAGGQWSQPGQR